MRTLLFHVPRKTLLRLSVLMGTKLKTKSPLRHRPSRRSLGGRLALLLLCPLLILALVTWLLRGLPPNQLQTKPRRHHLTPWRLLGGRIALLQLCPLLALRLKLRRGWQINPILLALTIPDRGLRAWLPTLVLGVHSRALILWLMLTRINLSWMMISLRMRNSKNTNVGLKTLQIGRAHV